MRHPSYFYSLTSSFSTTERGHSFKHSDNDDDNDDDDDDDDGLDKRATDATVRFTLTVFAGK